MRETMSSRAGRYVKQATGYSAFIPAPLPPNPALDMARLQVKLSKADRAIGRLDSIIGFVPNLQQFVAFYARKDAVLSSQIEGLHTTFIEVIEAEAGISPDPNSGDLQETRNYLDALWYGLDRQKVLPLSLRLIREMHERLIKGTRGTHKDPGEFRRTQNWIGLGGGTLVDAVYVPPPVLEMNQALFDLESYIYFEDEIPPLIRIGLIHAQFETIHPFQDGNGRIGRMLVTFLLVHFGILQHPILYSSLVFRLNREEYYARLQAVRDKGEWEEWISFFLDAITIAAKDGYERTKEIVSLKASIEKSIRETYPRTAGNLMNVVEQLMDRPIISSVNIQRDMAVSAATANRYLEDLIKIDVLSILNNQARNRFFYFHDYMKILDRDMSSDSDQPSLFTTK